MNMIDIVENFRSLSWVNIDCGFRQGQDAILNHLQHQFDQFHEDESYSVSQLIFAMQKSIEDLAKLIQPYQIPEDYKNFLEYYGGLAIDGIDCDFSVLGIGPMAETWYGYINSGDNILLESKKMGWLMIGQLVFRRDHKYKNKRVLFYLDLVGSVQKNCIIAIGPWNGIDPEESKVFEKIHDYSALWTKSADSFKEWLKLAGETRGAFTYV